MFLSGILATVFGENVAGGANVGVAQECWFKEAGQVLSGQPAHNIGINATLVCETAESQVTLDIGGDPMELPFPGGGLCVHRFAGGFVFV